LSINNKIDSLNLTPEYYDFIIIDECHHLTASSYRGIINYFKPKILLGLTATPERMDGGDILEDFSNRIAAEIRLPEALNRKLLCPFQYFGISDSLDLTQVGWERGRYIISELSNLYISNDRRVADIIKSLEKYTKDLNDIRAIGFCVSMEHAKFMAEKFLLAGLLADYLTSVNNQNRDLVRQKLLKKEINYLFVVDIFNEGVDIPEIDTVLFLRPTESLTVFLQQLGRGLRLADNKDCLTVLDFVGNSRPEYDYEGKFRALVGKTTTPIQKEIEDDFPHLPLGCSIVLEKKAKEFILENIRNATSLNKNQLVQKIQNYQHQTTLPLSLNNFSKFYHIRLQLIYKRGSWKRLCLLAGKIDEMGDVNEIEIHRAIKKKWLSCHSYSYFEFIKRIAEKNFDIDLYELSATEKQMCLMLHYDVWQDAGGFDSLEESIRAIGRNSILNQEIIEVMQILCNQIDYLETDILLPMEQPLKVHSRYTREQILAAFGFSTFESKSSIREGIALSNDKKLELLFITLNKSEKNFSPTTLYEDFAISETLFHWQSQNNVKQESAKGLSYINHQQENKKILLFVREKGEDEFGNTMGSVFLGEAKINEYYGNKPMSIKWELHEPMPPYLWKDSAKMAIG